MSFERDVAAYRDAEETPDPFGRQSYVLPRFWGAAHVMKRLVDAFNVIDATTTVPGPKAFGNNWPGMEREFSDLTDPAALRNHREAFEAAATRRRVRPTAFEIEMAEEACLWPAGFLPVDSQEIDALQLWILASARGVSVQRILNRRAAQADAMIESIRRSLGQHLGEVRDEAQLKATIRGVLATANALINGAEAAANAARKAEIETAAKLKAQQKIPDKEAAKLARRIKSQQRARREAADDVLYARKLAVERLNKIANFERLIIRPPQARIRRSEVLPGKVCDATQFDERRRLAAAEIAEKLHCRGVAVR